MRKVILMPGGILALLLVLGYYLMFVAPEDPAAGPGVAALAEQRAAPSRGEVTRDVIAESDLPPEGTRSLFDHLIAEQGALPFPFERMIEMLAAYDAEGRRPNTLLIPDGRSLLKGGADYADPRIVLAADIDPPSGVSLPPILRGRLFLGFVKHAEEIEVISYNEAAGRFEFQLVEDYCEGCVPRIVYAKRAVCRTCHVGGGPIFPVRPWEETNVQPAIRSRIRERVAGDHYHGAPLERRLENAEAFDDLTDVGIVIPTTQRIWLDGCGADGDECRRLLFKLAWRYSLNPAALDGEGPDIARLKSLQARHWPEEGIALANNDLSNRNPLERGLYEESLWARLKNIFSEPEARQLTGDKLADFDSLPPLPREFDPLTPRPPKKRIRADELDGVYGVVQMFMRADIARVEEQAGYSAAAVEAAIDSLDDALFGPQPLQRVALLRALLVALGGSEPPHCCLDTKDMSEPLLQGEPPLELAADSPLQPYERYCFACHRGNPAANLDFMSGDSEEVVLERIRNTDGIRDVLDYERYLGSSREGELMPPTDSWQRDALERAQAEGKTPLADMREPLPSFFEF